jgi:hypothetical protein
MATENAKDALVYFLGPQMGGWEANVLNPL